MQAEVLPVVGGKKDGRRYTSLALYNAGKGPAQHVAVALAVGDAYLANAVGSGFLPSDGRAVVRSDMEPHPNIKALIMCRDRDRRTWVWNLEGERKSYRGTRFNAGDAFLSYWYDFYGEDLSKRKRRGSEVDEH
jgi:hypothetical protein